MASKYNTESFIIKANEIHGNKYDYSKTIYNKYMEKVIIICKDHGEFQQTPNQHLTGKACKICGYEKIKENKRVSFTEFVKRGQEKHGDIFIYDEESYKEIADDIWLFKGNKE